MANQKLYEISSKVLEIPIEQINGEVSRENTDSWDSFNHLLLASAIEVEMGVKLTTTEIQGAKTIRDFENLIARRGL